VNNNSSIYKAVLHTVSTEARYHKQVESGEWVMTSRPAETAVNFVDFHLTDGKVTLPVKDGCNAEGVSSLLVTVLDRLENDTMRGAAGVLQAASDILRGIQLVGIHRTERILPLETPVTAVGQLRAKKGSGLGLDMELGKPTGGGPFYLSRKSLKELCEGLETSARVFKWAAIATGVTGAALIAFRLFRNWVAQRRANKLMAHVTESLRQQRGSDQASDQLANEANEVCCVCLTAPATWSTRPAGTWSAVPSARPTRCSAPSAGRGREPSASTGARRAREATTRFAASRPAAVIGTCRSIRCHSSSQQLLPFLRPFHRSRTN